MPFGTLHIETGWLNENHGQLVLRVDGGRRWRLDVGPILAWRARRLVGKRVRVEGVRDGFDLLDVGRIMPE
ncbi:MULTISPECIES: DUF5818 domain-containing protein [unclassified Sphingomonas]|uniref:DUF5818 domain-containing protein n=1 Tax=unclassified Sphingomonas TaxID=196159 RepID=UPI0009EC796D|nr:MULTISPECIES: DUF5818 domain-containing protein [unclassified Sphingomonas]